ncbi:MAG: hypothetical protein KatS3mg105_2846 [Gemmatales bacterium]|nr:MAG: hypothetical protein KatS3mg105_2846 [Gemmatales bacterium]
MVRLTAIYRKGPSQKFDFNYYVHKHLQLVREKLGAFGLLKIEVAKGLQSLDGTAAPFVCIANCDFLDLKSLLAGLDKHAASLIADVPNYTDIKPEVQINEIIEAGP